MSASTARVDLGAIIHNVAMVGDIAAPARVCAIVKADGYGHGSVPVARAALEAGATSLGVAQVGEARELRVAGIAAPLLVLSELAHDEIDAALAMELELVAHRPETIDALAGRATTLGVPPVPIHLKVDTGMRRVGCEPAEAADLAERIIAATGLRLAGTMTHLARADEPGVPATDHQLDRFDRVLDDLDSRGIDPGIRHAANSAGAIAHERARYDMVRVGIATYGIPPSPSMPGLPDLRPALRWTSAVRHVKAVGAGESVSYGHRHTFERDTVVATVPVGYADGFRRRLGLAGGAVLIGGRPCPVVGVVTMDQFVVDCGPDATASVGDEVVLIGDQGSARITADDVAGLLDTIGYEVVCDISSRVPRTYA
ncbi:MAG: alanine racemase [Acidimicrobiales bacterium]|nr:alanine racemase [Acidimicrobiales bacterium]